MITATSIIAIAAQGSTRWHITDRLFGPHVANSRQAIMSGLAGKVLPKSKCGFTACRQALAAHFGIDLTANCIAVVDEKLDAAIRAAALKEQKL